MRTQHCYLVALDGLDVRYKDQGQVGSRFLFVSESYRAAARSFIDRAQPGATQVLAPGMRRGAPPSAGS